MRFAVVYKLCFGVEDICRPAVDKARVPREPHHYQQNKETQDTDLSEGHGPQLAMLLTDHIIGSNVLLCLHGPTAPRLLEARRITWEITPWCHLHTPDAAKVS